MYFLSTALRVLVYPCKFYKTVSFSKYFVMNVLLLICSPSLYHHILYGTKNFLLLTSFCRSMCTVFQPIWIKSTTTTSSGGLLLEPYKGYVTARLKGGYRKHYYWQLLKSSSVTIFFSRLF